MAELSGSQPEVQETRRVRSTLARIVDRPKDRMALALIAVSATVASLGETMVLVVISLAALRLSSTDAVEVDLPFDVPIDELSTNRLLLFGAATLVMRLVALLANSYAAARLTQSVLYRWRRRLFEAYQRASWEDQSVQDEGYLQTLTQTYVGRLGSMLQQLSAAITAGISFTTFVVGAFVLSPFAALGLVFFGGSLFLLLRPLTRAVKRLSSVQSIAAKEYARLLDEASTMSLEHRVLGSGDSVSRLLDRQLLAQTRAARNQATLQRMAPQIYTGIGYAAILGGLAVAGRMPIGDIAVLGAMVLMMIRSLSYGQTFQGTTQGVAAAEPFAREVLDTVHSFEHSAQQFGPVEDGGVDSLELTNASVGYRGNSVASAINLQIEAGQSIGVVGPSGGGKSTLTLTMLGLLAPTDGSYEINGVPSADFSRSWWERNLSFVPQQPLLFDGTVAENIAMHRPNLSREDIEAAARAAHLGSELSSWPEGIDHRVGPRGGRLSGGQRQRICIARALVGKPSVLVLDEPTSALDGAAEVSIAEVLRELKTTCTLIVVAHRLSTLRFCDRILLVDEHTVKELGSGSELLASLDLDWFVDSEEDLTSSEEAAR